MRVPTSGVESLLFSHSVVSDSLRPRNCGMPGVPVPPYFPEFAQLKSIE